MVWEPVPTAVGVYVTEQLAELPEPLRLQLVLLKVPALSLAKVTMPVGVVTSLTVAVQVVEVPTITEDGVQLTPVVVEFTGTGVTKTAQLSMPLSVWMCPGQQLPFVVA